MRSWVIVLAACGGAAPPPPVAPQAAPVPARPRMHYIVEAGELGDRDIERKLEHHAYLARHSQAWPTLDSQAADRTETDLPAPVVVPILGEETNFLRVVSTDDGARIALWVLREAFTATIVSPTELLDSAGHPGDGVHGVWLAPGTAIKSAQREVTVIDQDLRVTGSVHDNALGLVWRGAVPPPVPSNTAGKPPYLDTAARIMAEPHDDARVLAKIVEMPSVTVIAKTGTWTEVALERGGMKLRGYVHSADVTTERAGLLGHGSGTGHGYGISDTEHVQVPAGACLYDARGQKVVGVNLEAKDRYGYKRVRDLSNVFVGTQYFGTMSLAVKWIDDKIELCTP